MPRIVVVALVLAAIIGAVVIYRLNREPQAQAPHAEQATSTVDATPAVESTRKTGAALATTTSAVTTAPSAPETTAISGLDLRSLAACHRNLLTKQHVESFDCANIEESETARRDQCRSQLAAVNLRLQELAAGAAPCPKGLAEPSVYYSAIRTLALGGDVGAQRCFIQGYFGQSHEDGKHIRPEQAEEYVQLARQFIDAALERGDWSVVRWLGRTRLHLPDGLLVKAYPVGIANRETIYKMKYLLVLGNQGDQIDASDPKAVVEGWRRDKKMTAKQFQDAEEWARTMYAQHFTGSQEGASIGVLDFCDSR